MGHALGMAEPDYRTPPQRRKRRKKRGQTEIRERENTGREKKERHVDGLEFGHTDVFTYSTCSEGSHSSHLEFCRSENLCKMWHALRCEKKCLPAAECLCLFPCGHERGSRAWGGSLNQQ